MESNNKKKHTHVVCVGWWFGEQAKKRYTFFWSVTAEAGA